MKQPENAYGVFCAEGSGPDPYGNLVDFTYDASVEDNPFRFSTKFWNAEVGLYDYGYRDYSPATGRWSSRDPLFEIAAIGALRRGNENVNQYDTWDLYAYCRNSPTGSIDADGRAGLPPYICRFLATWWGTVGFTFYCECKYHMDRMDEYCRVLKRGQMYVIPLFPPAYIAIEKGADGLCVPRLLITGPGYDEGVYVPAPGPITIAASKATVAARHGE